MVSIGLDIKRDKRPSERNNPIRYIYKAQRFPKNGPQKGENTTKKYYHSQQHQRSHTSYISFPFKNLFILFLLGTIKHPLIQNEKIPIVQSLL
jgi:hypothetical protein